MGSEVQVTKKRDIVKKAQIPLRIGIDLDGCVFDFITPFVQYFYKETGILVEPEEIVNYGWQIGENPIQMAELLHKVHDQFSPEGFRTLKTKIWAPEIIGELRSRKHEVFFITSRHQNTREVTLEALNNNGIPTVNNDLFITNTKAEVAVDLNLDIHIDDRPATVETVAEVIGRAILFHAPYNAHIDDDRIIRVTNWSAVLRAIQAVERELCRFRRSGKK